MALFLDTSLHRPRNANWPLRWVAGRCGLEKGTQRVLDSRYVPVSAPRPARSPTTTCSSATTLEMQGSCLRGATGFSKGLRIGCPGGGDALPGTSNRFVKREPSFNADYRGGVTCLYDTQLLGACLHAPECGGRYRPGAVSGMPEVPIVHPSTRPPEAGTRRGRAHRRSLGWAVGLVSPASFCIRGLWARLLRLLGSFPLFLGSERVRIWVIGPGSKRGNKSPID